MQTNLNINKYFLLLNFDSELLNFILLAYEFVVKNLVLQPCGMQLNILYLLSSFYVLVMFAALLPLAFLVI